MIRLSVEKVFSCPQTGNEGYVLKGADGIGAITYRSTIGASLAAGQAIDVDPSKWGFGRRNEGGLPVLMPLSRLNSGLSARAFEEAGFRVESLTDRAKRTAPAATPANPLAAPNPFGA